MVGAFAHRLNQRLIALSLPAGVLHAIQAERIRLAGLILPPEIDANTRITVIQTVRDSFVFGFRSVMLICAALSTAGATIAAKSIHDH